MGKPKKKSYSTGRGGRSAQPSDDDGEEPDHLSDTRSQHSLRTATSQSDVLNYNPNHHPNVKRTGGGHLFPTEMSRSAGPASTAHSSASSIDRPLPTSQSALSLLNQPDTLLETELQQIVDALNETSRKTSVSAREGAFERLVHLATYAHCPAILAEHLDDLTEATTKAIKKDHAVVAIQALALVVMQCATHMTCQPFLTMLSTFVKDAALTPSFRAAVQSRLSLMGIKMDSCSHQAIEGLGWIALLSDETDGETALLLMNMLQSAILMPHRASEQSSPVDGAAPASPTGENVEESDGLVLQKALHAWALLYSLKVVKLDEEDDLIWPAYFLELLDHPKLAIKTAAGEALGLMYEYHPKANFEHHGAIEKRVGQLSSEATKSTAKKDRATQKQTFRDVLATVESEGNLLPTEKIKLKSDEIVFEGWSQILQLDAFRQLAGEGLNIHLVQNERLKEIFDITAIYDGPDVTTQYERQLAKKLRQLNISSDRLGKRVQSSGR